MIRKICVFLTVLAVLLHTSGVALAATETVLYLDADGKSQTAAAKVLEGGVKILDEEWYIARGTWAFDETITVHGDVNLILEDGCRMTVTGFEADLDAGINVTEGNSFTIYAQSTGPEMGKLDATGAILGAGIGGGMYGNGGIITICGGSVTATGGDKGAGIGGGIYGNGGIITICGGSVMAAGGDKGTGIGAGSGDDFDPVGNGGTVKITGGIVKATGGGNAQAIGKGEGIGDPGTTEITGGSVEADQSKVDNPTNANGAALKRCDQDYAGYAGKAVSFSVPVAPEYIYSFTVPEGGTAYLWLPDGVSSDYLDLVKAKLIIENEIYEAARGDARNITKAKAAVEAFIGALKLPDGVTFTVNDITFTAAKALTDGAYTFNVTLEKGTASLETSAIDMLITAAASGDGGCLNAGTGTLGILALLACLRRRRK